MKTPVSEKDKGGELASAFSFSYKLLKMKKPVKTLLKAKSKKHTVSSSPGIKTEFPCL
jgi:hypothetical protein